MIPRRFEKILFPFILSALMSFIVSGISMLRAIGFVDNFLILWLSSWVISWIISFPTVLVAAPLTKWIVSKITRDY